MTHASLFSGIGGFDLAAEWAGWTNVFNCEIDPFCCKVLAYHFPNAIQYEDVKATDFTVHRGGVDVLTGGFPCQPFSLAGKRRGTNDDRYLWPEMLRAIREIRPRWVVGENVLGIVNWSDGMVFEQVCADLEGEGYEVQPFLIPACAVDAPHRRDRVWFVAHRTDVADSGNAGIEVLQRERTISVSANRNVTYADQLGDSPSKESGTTNGVGTQNASSPRSGRSRSERTNRRADVCGVDSDAENAGQQTCSARQREIEPRRGDRGTIRGRFFDGFPTQSPVCGRDDGFPARLDACPVLEWLRPNGRFRFSGYWRRESIKAYGNAVVPQVVLQIFETINEYENALQTEIPDAR